MTASIIEGMIDAACRCAKCDQAGLLGSCGCWILLECPHCSRRLWVDRDPADPPETARVIYPCPTHDEPDGPAPRYFNGLGTEIFLEDT